MDRQLRSRYGPLKFFSISRSAEITCDLDPEFEVRQRVQGKRKKYIQVHLLQNGSLRWFYLHRLMAFSFLKPCSPLRMIVDHIDGDAFNNNVCNLRWVTPTGNNLNRPCYGLRKVGKLYIPRIAKFEHHRFGSPDESVALEARRMLVQCYVRFTMKFPEKGNSFPHKKICFF